MESSSSSSPEISAAPTTIMADNSSNYTSLDDALDDLSSRFILNLPESELASVERVCFQVEQAHWFYEDFVRESNPQFPSFPLKKFSQIFFRACPVLHRWNSDFEIAFNNFMQYKTRVPVCGAIMLNDRWEKCILVKGWKSSAGWGFPKGKINQDEEPHKCAVREVFEETGYDLTGKVNQDHVIEMSIKQQKISLYIVPGVPEDYPFKTRTRKEISKIDWFKLSDLPTWKKSGSSSGKFYLISPFIAPLKNFIQEHKPVTVKRNNRRSRNNGYLNRLPPPDESAESSAESPPHSHSVADNTQETSSQSNGPTTPSPKYGQLEPYVVKEEPSEKPIITADPHLARLMESLSMSALQSGNETKPALSSIVTENRTPPPSAATPVPATASSVDSRPSAGSTVDPAKRTPEADITPNLTTDPQVTPNSGEAIQSARPPPSLASAVSLSPRHHRSISALSYPTRPAELASSAKRMKHLALLESVVDESARSTPTLEQQRANLQGPMFSSGSPVIHRSAAASVPPQNTMFPGLVPGSVLYSSDRGFGFPQRVQSIPPPVNGIPQPLCSTIGPDSLTRRPLDALLVNPAPLHPGNGLLPSMSGGYTQAVPPPPLLQPVPQYNQQIPGPLTSNVPPLPRHVGSQPFPGQYGVKMPATYNSFAARPQSAIPYPTYPALSAPGVGPQFPLPSLSPQLSQPRGNPQLLSILNSRGPGPASIQTSTIPPVGNITGFQPR